MIVYCPVTGKFFREYKNHSRETALSVNSAGYHTLWYNGKCRPAHQVAYLLMGVEVKPGWVVDHINRVRTDNRWCNLRVVPDKVNRHNRGQTKGRTLPTGVRVTSSGKYQARVRVDGKLLSLGSYDSVDTALAAYQGFKISIEQPIKEGQINA
nr:MAG TPA_asm: homing endonuclease [Caudoviricetes sp.]